MRTLYLGWSSVNNFSVHNIYHCSIFVLIIQLIRLEVHDSVCVIVLFIIFKQFEMENYHCFLNVANISVVLTEK